MLRHTLALLALTCPLGAATKVFQSFEGDGFGDWKVEGTAFGLAPVAEKTPEMKSSFTGYANERLAASSHGGDAAKGSLTSPEFTVSEPYITFLIAGGDYPGKTAAQLIIDDKVVIESTGKRSLTTRSEVWDVAAHRGKRAKIRLIDDEEGPWGIIAVDHIIFTDYANQKYPTTTRAGKPFVQGLVPAKVLAGVNIPADTTLTVEATYKDQKVTSPTAITFDDQGRLYVSETHRFRKGVEDDRDRLFWYLDDLASRKTSDRRALHEKWKAKVPLADLTAKSEVIRRLADTTGDGKLDQSTVFADGFNDVLDGTGAGVFYYEGSLYFACIPKIWALRDNNGDGIADEKKVVEEGFGVRISLSGHDLNGFTLGPDGRIYGTVGDRGFSMITKAGVSYDYPDEGAAFRFEPDGTGFEIFHTGLRNPKEIAFDSLGNAFSVDNNSDQGDQARVVYLVEGGDSGWQMEHQTMHTFHRQIGLEERPTSRWMNERIWELENPSQAAYLLPPCSYLSSGPSGLTYHPGAGFLQSEAGRFLICDYRGGAANSGIWSFEMKPKGAGMQMTDARQFVWGIGATDVEYSWDGRLFISDFITGWTTHEDGRILSLNPGDKMWQADEAASTPRLMRDGFDHRPSAELAMLLKHPDGRVRLRAQIALTRKPDALKRFTEASTYSNFTVRIHGIWGLGILSRRGAVPLPNARFSDIPSMKTRAEADAQLITLLQDNNPEIRAQSLRALASATENINIPLVPLLQDASPRVRFFAAILAGKRRMIAFYGPICDMLVENNNRDVYLRHAGSFALQHMAPTPAAVSALTSHESPAVRLAAAVALRRMKSNEIGKFLADPDPKVVDEAIRAVTDLDLTAVRPAVAQILDRPEVASFAPFLQRRLIHNSFRLGTAEDASRVLKYASDPAHPEAERKEALRLISIWATPPPADQLTGHYNPLPKRDPAILRPILTAALPDLLKQDGFILTAALELVSTYQLEISSLDDGTLRSLAANRELPAKARSEAIQLVVAREPQDLEDFLTGLSREPSPEVAITALDRLAARSPAAAVGPLEAAITTGSSPLARRAWGILGTLSGDDVDAIFVKHLNELTQALGLSPTAIELLDAARTRKNPQVIAAVEGYDQAIAASPDLMAKWNIALQGGDPKAGEAIFTSHPASECMRCHRAEDGHSAGGDTAPNLAGIANRHKDRRYFIESMVAPSAVIAPGFGTILIDFKNGGTLSGNLLEETPEHLDVDSAGTVLRVRREDVASFTPPVSPMPAMDGPLNPAELRDLVAWLGSLTKGGAPAKVAVTPEPFDPSTLHPSKPELPAGVSAAFLKTGQQQYLVCGACHGQSGEGTAAGPPLAGSEWVNGPVENLIRIQLRGLQGPIKVKGQEYNFPAGMAALAYQTDDQIAAVLTYVRNAFGNSAPPVSPAEVAALRSEVGKPQLTSAELIPPPAAAGATPAPAAPAKQTEDSSSGASTAPGASATSAATAPAAAKAETPPASDKYRFLAKDSSSSKGVAIVVAALAALVAMFVMKNK